VVLSPVLAGRYEHSDSQVLMPSLSCTAVYCMYYTALYALYFTVTGLHRIVLSSNLNLLICTVELYHYICYYCNDEVGPDRHLQYNRSTEHSLLTITFPIPPTVHQYNTYIIFTPYLKSLVVLPRLPIGWMSGVALLPPPGCSFRSTAHRYSGAHAHCIKLSLISQ
jgi:hypothetical protein